MVSAVKNVMQVVNDVLREMPKEHILDVADDKLLARLVTPEAEARFGEFEFYCAKRSVHKR